MIIKGFRFGLLLQLAVGPICLFIFQTASTSGFRIAMMGVMGVSVVDGLYIFAAISGIGLLLTKYKSFMKILQLSGAIILMFFGLQSIMNVLNISILPSIQLLTDQGIDNIFLKTMILTLSNPLTILFWISVFSTKMIEASMTKPDMYLFGLGSVLSTIFFLTTVSILGYFVNTFLPLSIVRYLNVIVGLFLIVLGIKATCSVKR